MSVDELEKAVAALPPDKFAKFRTWFEEFAADAWDRQIEADAKSGKLDKLVENPKRIFAPGAIANCKG